ncbi:MAG: hypothetical protein JW952_07895 [Candidatus Eisenbacteria bacterium]|nr:hypothetical protein [Candidatus Eisenbacteria bacterium]
MKDGAKSRPRSALDGVVPWFGELLADARLTAAASGDVAEGESIRTRHDNRNIENSGNERRQGRVDMGCLLCPSTCGRSAARCRE